MSAMTADAGLVEAFDEFFRRYYREEIGDLARRYPNEQRSLEVDYRDLERYDVDLADDFLDAPRRVKRAAEEALAQHDLPVDISLGNAAVRVAHLPDWRTHEVGGYSPSEMHGRYLAIEGQVAKTTDVQPRPLEYVFECVRCGHLTTVVQEGGRSDPHECESCERQGPFQIRSDKSTYDDFQLVRIAQPPEQTQGGQGSEIDVHVNNDLVETADPGDRVVITGILEFQEDTTSDDLPDLYLDAHAITVKETDYEEIEIDEEDEQRIEAIAAGAEGDPYELLVDSIAPKIRGYDTIKKAIALQMFGGVRVVHPNENVDRGNSHIALIGDPGTGKSNLLRTAETIAPRSVYASGKGASAAGMTAAAVRDDFGNAEWTLEAGALVKADGGVACVDEIDKVNEDAVSSMHDALSSGRVNVNKAGINTTLRAESALLAAGNPKDGRIDPYAPMYEQIDIGPTLLSRFDLIFVLQDRPDEEEDPKTAEHVIESRRTAKALEDGRDSDDVDDVDRERIEPPLDAEFLRKYIAHARQSVAPRIKDDEVSEHLQQSFVSLRAVNGYDDEGPVPVGWRKLEGILRLAEAAAKVELSPEITQRHIDVARELVGESLRQFGQDEDGEYDTDVIEAGTSQTQRERVRNVQSVIEELQEGKRGGVPLEDVYETLEEAQGIDRHKAEHEIERLKQKGELFEPENGEVRSV